MTNTTTWQPAATLLAAIRDRSVWETRAMFAAWAATLRACVKTSTVPVQVLDLLADTPGQWYTSNQLAEALDIDTHDLGALQVYTAASRAVLEVPTTDAFWPVEVEYAAADGRSRYRVNARIASLWRGDADTR